MEQWAWAIRHRFVEFLLPQIPILGISDSICVCLHSDFSVCVVHMSQRSCVADGLCKHFIGRMTKIPPVSLCHLTIYTYLKNLPTHTLNTLLQKLYYVKRIQYSVLIQRFGIVHIMLGNFRANTLGTMQNIAYLI